MFIGETLRKKRKEKGMTQKQLAEALGVSTMTIQRYESNAREVKDKMLMNICEALDISPLSFKFDFYVDEPNMKTTLGEAEKSVKLNILIKAYKKLNSDGQDIAIERVEELTEIERYTKPDAEPPQD